MYQNYFLIRTVSLQYNDLMEKIKWDLGTIQYFTRNNTYTLIRGTKKWHRYYSHH